MKKIALLLVSTMACLMVHAQTNYNDSISLIKANYLNAMLGNDSDKQALIQLLKQIPPEQEVSDQNVIELQRLYPISPKEVKRLTKSLAPDGAWKDIDYADAKRSGWNPKAHADRILKLAQYHYLNRHALSGSEKQRICQAIHQAMNFWFKAQLRCPNWWYNEIGIPRTLGPAFLMFETEMSKAEKEEAVRVMMNSSFGMTGQNKVWLAGNVLIRGLLQNDWALVKEARNQICSEIVLGQKEGIKADWSFHQHGPQQQFSNYGLAFLWNMSFYAETFSQTSLALSQEQQHILVSLLLEGYQWIAWKGHLDVNGLNRQLFHNADTDKTFSLLFAALSLKKCAQPDEAAAIRQMVERNSTGTAATNTFVGTKHFWESDYTIHRTSHWMASLRMASERVIGTELVNEDNLKGYYMADGAMYTYSRGDEYHNIFPFWDWRRIPGITTFESNAPIPNPNRTDARNHSYHVGGVSFGQTGISAMRLDRNKLQANKAWIFTGNFVLSMGSDIHADSTATLVTSIDQRYSTGHFWTDDTRKRIFHDNTGYIVLDADSCIMLNEKKTGQWRDFMGMYKADMLKGKIFSIYLKHRGDRPASYIYLTLPATTRQAVQDFDTASVRVVRNDRDVQAATIDGLCYVSAYRPARISIAHNRTISIGTPGIYIISVDNGEIVAQRAF